VRVDHARGVDAARNHGLHLGLGGAVKARAGGSERVEDAVVVVALDRVKGLDARQRLDPAVVLAQDIARVNDVKGLKVLALACHLAHQRAPRLKRRAVDVQRMLRRNRGGGRGGGRAGGGH